MAGLRKLLGIFPNTEKYEKKRDDLYAEYIRLQDIAGSDNYKRFLELDAYIKSESFINKKKELLGLRYKKSKEFSTEKSYQKLAKRKDVKSFLTTKDSEALRLYTTVADGDDLKKIDELTKFTQSEVFLKVKNYHKLSGKKKFLQSELNKTLLQLNKLEKQTDFKAYNKFVKHKLFEVFKQVEGSSKLQEYQELKKEIESDEFKEKKSAMKKAEFAESLLFKKQTRYTELSKDREIKSYFKLLKSSNYSYYSKLVESAELEAYLDLKEFVASDDFAAQKQTIETSKFEETEEFNKEQKLLELRKKQEVVHYYKFKKSKPYKIYNTVKDSEVLKEYEKLKKEVESENFQARKAFLTMNAKQRYSKSEENKKEQEYNELAQSEEIKFYQKNHGAKQYSWFRTWNPVFQETFDSAALDKERWITKYYWGDKTLNDSYSTEGEFQYITDGDNLEISEGTLKIVTKQEHVDGKAWNSQFGFVPREFEYTSGLVNSGDSFCQKYGAIEAKVKLTSNKNILEAIWLISKEKNLPHIDLIKANGKSYLGYQWGNTAEDKRSFYKKFSRGKFADKFFIFSLEWTAEAIVWKINGDVVAKQTSDIPDKEMYLLASAHLYKKVNEQLLPSNFEIDWIKCYQHNDYQKDKS